MGRERIKSIKYADGRVVLVESEKNSYSTSVENILRMSKDIGMKIWMSEGISYM